MNLNFFTAKDAKVREVNQGFPLRPFAPFAVGVFEFEPVLVHAF
jgi:hypothetical protein